VACPAQADVEHAQISWITVDQQHAVTHVKIASTRCSSEIRPTKNPKNISARRSRFPTLARHAARVYREELAVARDAAFQSVIMVLIK
jgi:hypothetical protein